MEKRWRTLAERREAFREAFATAVATLVCDLEDYARRHGGRFILFGSAVNGHTHDRSDVDLIVDFPPETVSGACRFAERACDDRGLVPDVRPVGWTSDPLMHRALSTGRIVS